MYAIFQNGGKQYKVQTNQIIQIEKTNIIIGGIIEFNQVLMISDENDIKIGTPFIYGARIIAKVIIHAREKKVIIIKFHRRKHSRKHQGHRQWFTQVKIINIFSKA